MCMTITVATTYRRGRRLFARGDVASYAATHEDGSSARGIVWVENPAEWDEPRVGPASEFRHLFAAGERREGSRTL